MKKIMLIIAVVCTLTLTNDSSTSAGKDLKHYDLIVKGTVVASVVSSSNFVKFSGDMMPNDRILLVRIESITQGKQDSRYIWVTYRYYDPEPSLPDEIYDGNRQQCLSLTRAPQWDSSVKGMIPDIEERRGDGTMPRLDPTKGAEHELIPLDTVFPCYLLSPKGLSLDDDKCQSG